MYNASCWLNFPFEFDGYRIVVFWDTLIDSKYDFDIVKAMRRVDKKHIGKPFMELTLINDSTLHAKYLIPDIVRNINESDKTHTLFPKTFYASKGVF